MNQFKTLQLDAIVIDKDNEDMEKQYNQDYKNFDGKKEINVARDLAGIETYEQNDAALNTYLIE